MRNKASLIAGLTLTELLVATGVAIFLVALTYPVLTNAVAGSKKSVTVSNLRQLAQATALYRTSYSESESGTWQQMGLPSDLFALDVDPKIIHTLGPTRKGLIMLYTNQGLNLTWEEYSSKYGGSAVFLGDLSWTDSNSDVMADEDAKVGYGAYLDTHVRRRVGEGDWVDFEWWHNKTSLMK